ncbi:MAG: tRNA (guanosine(37)-N1)-methyltransferase TrmD [Gammaproteobacteria bacterium]|nr:tRNA (guanosine(37)-N1)-methyltransferase TrmD [Gammaproteobacteria bacterium]
MEIHAITLIPELVTAVTEHGVTGRAVQRGLLSVTTWNPREYTHDVHRSVDDRAYGGGPGMVLKAEPLDAAVAAARVAAPAGSKVVYLSPQGQPVGQRMLVRHAREPGLILVCGRYEGVDERFVETVDEEWSLGDYVISGGELAAMVVIDALARLQPGALGDAESALQDSFSGALLDHPHYTRPEKLASRRVPAVLLSGDHAAIERWRRQQALGRTWRRRPDLLARLSLCDEDERLLEEYKRQLGDENPGAGEDL